MTGDRCPLLLDDRYVSEGDIPDECRACLAISLDSEQSHGMSEIIGVPSMEDYSQRIDEKPCKHDMYYWQTSIRRGKGAQRIIEIAAECDVCENFVSTTNIAICKTES